MVHASALHEAAFQNTTFHLWMHASCLHDTGANEVTFDKSTEKTQKVEMTTLLLNVKLKAAAPRLLE